MALANTKDPEEMARLLTLALERHLEGARDVTVFDLRVPRASGMSNETVLFDARWTQNGTAHHEPLVARVQPAGPAVFPRYDFGLEFAVMWALEHETDVPVPHMLFVDTDPGLLGAPFMVMRRIEGQVAADDPPYTAEGWVLDLAPDERATLCDNAVRVLSGLHAVDLEDAGLSQLRVHPESGLDGQLRFWRETFDWGREGEDNVVVEAAFAWLEANTPEDPGELVLSWGDARLGNMIVAHDLSIAAVLDWEMVCVAPAGVDVGWWLFMVRHHTEGLGLELPDGFPTAAEFLARYEQLTSQAVHDIHFWEVLAATRLAALMHRAGNLMTTLGLLPPDAPMKRNNPASQLLARLLRLPAPDGAAQSFIGNRA